MAEALTCAEKLVLAKAALDELLRGKMRTSVSYGDRKVQYEKSDIATLRGYIAQLEDECGERTERSIRRPIRGVFG